jgi:hypothetical protein
MHIDIASLVGQWDTVQSLVLCPDTRQTRVLIADPSRFAFGVACTDVTAIAALTGSTILLGLTGIPLNGASFLWFDWHKFATMVSRAWFVNNFSGHDINVSVFEVKQTDVR